VNLTVFFEHEIKKKAGYACDDKKFKLIKIKIKIKPG
jgi:hypothetical protein